MRDETAWLTIFAKKSLMAEEKDAINDQIRDSVSQISRLLLDSESSTVRAMSYQVMAHTIALSMYNIVHQQQQLYVLQNAATTAAIKEALKSNPADAVKIAQQAIVDCDMTRVIAQLKQMMDELNETYKDVKAEVVQAQAKPKPTAKPKRAQKTQPKPGPK